MENVWEAQESSIHALQSTSDDRNRVKTEKLGGASERKTHKLSFEIANESVFPFEEIKTKHERKVVLSLR